MSELPVSMYMCALLRILLHVFRDFLSNPCLHPPSPSLSPLPFPPPFRPPSLLPHPSSHHSSSHPSLLLPLLPSSSLSHSSSHHSSPPPPLTAAGGQPRGVKCEPDGALLSRDAAVWCCSSVPHNLICPDTAVHRMAGVLPACTPGMPVALLHKGCWYIAGGRGGRGVGLERYLRVGSQ